MSYAPLIEKVAKAAKYVPTSIAKDGTNAKQTILENLEALGITNDEQGYELLMSEHCKFGYAREQFVDKSGIPIVVFSKIWGILTEGGSTPEEPSEIKVQSIKIHTVGQMSTKELLEQYGPDCSSEIEEELHNRSNGRNVIVFEQDKKTVNIKHSLKFMKEAKHHITPSEYVDGIGNAYTVWPVGQWPNQTYDICPVTKDVLIDDYCASLGVSWAGVDEHCREFIAVMKSKGINLDLMNVTQVIELAKTQGLKGLKQRFQTVSLEYDRLKEEIRLPILKISNRTITERRKNAFEPTVHRH